jgi:hypothetical protein
MSIDTGRVINTMMAFWSYNPKSQPQPSEASSSVTKKKWQETSTHATFSSMKSLSWIQHILSTAIFTNYFNICNIPVSAETVNLSLFQHTVLKQFWNSKTHIQKFQKIQINKSKWDFVPWNTVYWDYTKTQPAAKPVYSLNATSISTNTAELSHLQCRHTCKQHSSEKVSPTWEWGWAGTRVLVVLIWRSWTHTHTHTRKLVTRQEG